MPVRRGLAICTLALMLGACGDGFGPRPRPGGPDPVEPGSTADHTLAWYSWEPRVLVPGQTDSMTLTVRVNGDQPSVQYFGRTGEYKPLTPGRQLYTVRLPAAQLLSGYRDGDLHHATGVVEIVGAQNRRYNIVVNVRTPAVPGINIRSLVPGIQAGPHVVNLRMDDEFAGGALPASITRAFYDHFGDDYDFIAVIEAVSSTNHRVYQSVRNQVTGLGLDRFDQGDHWGSDTRLQGIIRYPADPLFDLAETGNLHEIGHRWINFAKSGPLTSGKPHWPVSDLAYGIMGRTDPGTGQGTDFPFQLTPQVDGSLLAERVEPARIFNDLELYLMGLLSADSVSPHFVFRDQTQVAQVRDRAVLRLQLDTIRVSDLIARDGARNPGAAQSPPTFRIATIVLSRGGVLNASEMAFFDHLAARGELTTRVSYSTGLVRADTQPFFLATGGRGRLNATLW